MQLKYCLLIIGLLLLVSCAKHNVVNVGILKDAQANLPVEYAYKNNLYKDIRVKLIRYNQITDLTEDFRKGKVELAVLPFPQIWILAKDMKDVTVCSGIANGGDAILSLESIHTLEDMKYKSVGVVPATMGEYLIKYFSDYYKIPVQITYYKNEKELLAALYSGQIPLASTSYPNEYPIPEDYHVFMNYNNKLGYYPSWNLLCKGDYPEERDFVSQTGKIIAYINAKPKVAQKLLVDYYGIDKEQVVNASQFMQYDTRITTKGKDFECEMIHYVFPKKIMKDIAKRIFIK